MQKKYKLFILLSAFCCLPAIGQQIFKEHFGPCATEAFSLEFNSIETRYPIKQLLKDIIQSTDSLILNDLRGDIYFQVIVDTLGNPCVLSVRNHINFKTKKTNFVKTINEKTVWGYPSSEERNPLRPTERMNVAAIIYLSFSKDSIIIRRLGWDESRRDWNELEMYREDKK